MRRFLVATIAAALLAGAATTTATAAPSVYFADLSGYNENVDLRAYKAAGHNIVALKATEGASFRSDAFVPRWKLCHQLGMVCMAYHFAKPTRGPPEPDARNFAAWVKRHGWRAGDVGVLDFEDPGYGTKGSEWIVRFVRTAALEGVRVPLLYSYGPYVASRLTTTSGLDYWHAGYIRDPLSSAPVFARQRAVAIQFTNGQDGATPHWLPGMGTIAGTRHGDVNKRIVTLARFKAMAYSQTPTVKGGDTGPNVRWAVDRLMRLGYLPYPKLGRPRSVFGGWVNTAVVHFKRDYHLPATPVVDNPTRTAIAHAITARDAAGTKPETRPPLKPVARKAPTLLVQKDDAAKTAPLPVKAKRPVAHCVYRVPLRQGNGGRDIAVLHVRMVELGLWPKSASGHASRYFGRGTTLAIKRFQRKTHRTADGVIGSSTLKGLGMSVCLPNAAGLRVTVALDGTPTYRGLALMLQDGRAHGGGCGLNSSDRRPGVAERYGRQSQAALYYGWSHRLPGFNPANPPGRSTHEQRSDGVAYAGPVGRVLEWWQLGMDVSNSTGCLAVLNRLGYHARRPYPDGRERHHLNIGQNPTPVLRRHKLAR